jgi:hypothetical protein
LKKPLKTAAVLTLNAPGAMTAVGRLAIAQWLRRHATMLLKEGKNYTKTKFRGRYLYT